MTRDSISFLLPDLNDGGAQVVLINLANTLAARGRNACLVIANGRGAARQRVSPAVRVFDLGSTRSIYAIPALIRFLIRMRPKTVVSATSHMNVIASAIRAISPRNGFRLVLTEHTIVSARPDLGQVRSLIPALYRFADRVVGVSEGVRSDIAALADLPADKTTAIFNPVVTSSFDRLLEEEPPGCLSALKGHRIIVTCGRLHPIKDQETLIRAFAHLAPGLDAHLVLLGDGPLRSELERLAEELQISDRVHFLGYVQNPLAYMKHADVFAMSSKIEGLPTVLVEALYCGLTVVSTDCPSGPREILKEGELGRLVPVGDVEALSQALAIALTSPCDTSALKMRAQDFSADRIADQYEALFQSLGGPP